MHYTRVFRGMETWMAKREVVRFILRHPYGYGAVIVPDKLMIDVVVNMGIQPSQVKLANELTNSGQSFDMTIGV